MTGPGIEVRGARELRRTLRRAGADMSELNRVHKEAAALVEAATRAPVRTGRLQTTVRSAGTRTAGIVRAGYASVPYAGPIHWGWPSRGIRANPFISEAAQRTEPTWFGLYEREIERLLDSIQGV